MYWRLGHWDELLQTYRRELKVTPRGPAAAALLFKIGELCEDRVGRDQEAISSYRQAIAVDPTHLPALHALERKLAERGEWEELVKLLETELGQQTEPAVRARAPRFAWAKSTKIGWARPDKALAAYEQSLAAAPDFRPALDGRTRLLAQARDWPRLVDALEREAASTQDPELSLSALLLRGELLRDELSDRARAIQSFEAILERNPAHVGALLALEPLYAAGRQVGRARARFRAEAQVLTDTGARAAALRELARLQEAKGIGGPAELKQTYFGILGLLPNDIGALRALERIALGDGDRQLLAHVDAKLAALESDPARFCGASHAARRNAGSGRRSQRARRVPRGACARRGKSGCVPWIEPARRAQRRRGPARRGGRARGARHRRQSGGGTATRQSLRACQPAR